MEIQLELNVDKKTPEEMQLYLMQKQLDDMCITMDKVRKRLFAEVGELKKMCAVLQKENYEIKSALEETNHGKKTSIQTSHRQDGYLFDVQQYQKVAG